MFYRNKLRINNSGNPPFLVSEGQALGDERRDTVSRSGARVRAAGSVQWGMQLSTHSTGAVLKEFAHLPLGAVVADTGLNEMREKWGSSAMDLINETEVIEGMQISSCAMMVVARRNIR